MNRPATIRRLAGVVAALTILAVAPGLLLQGCGGAGKRPNILIVVLDTVRRDATGLTTAATPPELRRLDLTPNLTRLGATGTLYRNAWSAAPWTVPAHASLFTGLLPSAHGCNGRRPTLSPVLPTFAERLTDDGYRSAAFFSNPWLSERTSGLLRGFAELHEAPIGGLDRLESGGGDQGGGRILADLEAWLDARADDAPFLAFVNLLEAHLPYAPDAAARRAVTPDLPADAVVPITWGHEYNAGLHPAAEVDWARVRGLYAADVRTVDALLGRLLSLLDARGLRDDTIVVVTSDHGENLGEHGLFEHQFSVHETLLAVPLVVVDPRRPVRAVVDTPVVLTDLYGAVLAWAGFPPPAGRGLGETTGEPRVLVAEYAGPSPGLVQMLEGLKPGADLSRLRPALRTVRVGDTRLTENSEGLVWLHDLEADPGQLRNLAAARQEGVQALQGLFMAEIARTPEDPDTPVVDEETRRRLESLGYIH
jgi:arylsulfatase A-like enzyme